MLSAHHCYPHTVTARFSMHGILAPIQDAEIVPAVPGELLTLGYEVPRSGDGPAQERVALAASAVGSLRWSVNGSAFYACPTERLDLRVQAELQRGAPRWSSAQCHRSARADRRRAEPRPGSVPRERDAADL